ncbi:unnamed protein product [Allacma fusca]|uniref:Major facilitator superfamily (MFS) profile domain-containing protein n=1 Tax=Allacma fusca TaxID=39272 RepID=A0A8J2NUS2_9HEXA|nr:unnamed protein product [Allacma fusca]
MPVQEGFSNSFTERLMDSRNAEFVRSMSPDQQLQKRASLDGIATYKQYKAEFLTDTFVLLFSMHFILLFCVSGVETIIPVITQKYIGYGVFENSLIYMIGGLEALILFVGIAFIGPYVRDTTLQVIGWLLILFSQILLVIVIPNFEEGNVTHVVYFILGIAILYMGDPIFFVATTGLVSKVLSNETQGLGQGLCRLALYLGLIYGPTWSGSTINKPYLSIGASVTILLLIGIMFACSFSNLRRAEDLLAESKMKQATYEELNETLSEVMDEDDETLPFVRDV